MPCEEGMRREDEAFKKLSSAISQRSRIAAPVAAYTDHWEAYEATVAHLAAALSEYEAAATALMEDRAAHLRPVARRRDASVIGTVARA